MYLPAAIAAGAGFLFAVLLGGMLTDPLAVRAPDQADEPMFLAHRHWLR